MIEKINLPSDLKNLSNNELSLLSKEIREQIIYTVNQNGGHLSSNLGTVELILALHKVFNTPKDKLIFDVGHQCYAHKIITGRKDRFITMRQSGGLSGYINPAESVYDTVIAGHSSTSLSQALGFCRARDLKGEDYHVIAVIGDGSLGSGMAFEALNDIGNSHTRLIIVLNDNEMSIEKNVGAVSHHLSKLRLSKGYINIKKGFKKFIFSIPVIGKPLNKIADAIKRLIIKVFVSKSIFDCLGISYFGTFDGNDIPELVKAFNSAMEMDKPVVLHINTKKGMGYEPAEQNPGLYHSTRKGFLSGQTDFSAKTGQTLCDLALKNDRIIAVTAAMKDGTGLTEFAKKYPERFFDVGICEQHAITMCAGMAANGFKPYFCVYSTFLQRAFDQISNDVCLPKLPVTLIIDRAGLVGSDGETHHGVLDIAYLSCLPDMTVYAPKDLQDLQSVIEFSERFNSPLAIRYENEYEGEFDLHTAVEHGKWEIICPVDSVNIIAYGGRMLHTALKVKDILKEKGINCGVINSAFIKPLDKILLNSLNGKCIVLEESMPFGSLYSMICSYIFTNNLSLRAIPVTLRDRYITHGSVKDLLKDNDMSPQSIAEKLVKEI